MQVQLGANLVNAFSVYMTVGHGMGDNAAKYSILASWARALPYPWLMVGDWNLDPDVLENSNWLDFAQGLLIRPEGTLVTCSQGAQGSLLDYCVASRSAATLIRSVTALEEVPMEASLSPRHQDQERPEARPGEGPHAEQQDSSSTMQAQ